MKNYFLIVILGLSFSSLFTACDDDDDNVDDKNENEYVEATIDDTGGSLTTLDGVMELVIPPNALSSQTMVSVELPDPLPPDNVTNRLTLSQTLFDWSPDGLQFNLPASLTYNYRNDNVPIPGADEVLTLATYEAGEWLEVPSSVNAAEKSITAEIEHFSLWTIVDKSNWQINYNGTNYLMDNSKSEFFNEGLTDPFDEDLNTNPTHYLYNLYISEAQEAIEIDMYLFAPEEADFSNSTFEFIDINNATPEDLANLTFTTDVRVVLNNQVDIKPVSGTVQVIGDAANNKFLVKLNLTYPDDESLTGNYYGTFTRVQ
ncbi:hypothetical protein [Marinigracilibium pacificum]|uniref:ZU5 domain-containing protein n=1 Tax=Marinigracilibium pacificum TaxID=2729599 RepID=A0A848IYZ0_9BACT|nr:hypothetical protein [Marinigracilibium pacificum]NMM48561.1 hypothetical protein [Marinigracilibium pacificum]